MNTVVRNAIFIGTYLTCIIVLVLINTESLLLNPGELI